jgi:hypothetical protein
MLLAALPMSAAAASELCTRWSPPQVLGQLDFRLIPEASGIGVARDAERIYHINDGNRPEFLVTDRAGSLLQQVQVEGFAPVDVEDLALGRCGERTCVYLADVGDNARRRDFVRIAVIEEAPRFGARITPRAIITARYPDGPHNAEAIALHPSGDLFLVTKSGSGAGQAGPARVYRLGAAQLAAGGEQQFEARGEIPVPALTGTGIERRRVVTAMDIAPDGGRLLLLTYDSAIEIAADLAEPLPGPSGWSEGRTHRTVPIAPLIQAESIAYDRDGRSILYSTESVRDSAVPLIRQGCGD